MKHASAQSNLENRTVSSRMKPENAGEIIYLGVHEPMNLKLARVSRYYILFNNDWLET